MSERKKIDRRDFMRGAAAVAFSGVTWAAVGPKAEAKYWQLDPAKCTQCGRCETHCVLTPSASKCFHAYEMCGYCDLCGAYLRQGVRNINTGAESQLCPTGAILRTFVEDPYFQYKIDEELCIGCAKCVKGCADFGNGSLYMQINQNICVNCNECSIARACPSDAISRVPASRPYITKDGYMPKQ